MANGDPDQAEGDIRNSQVFKSVSEIAAKTGLPQPMTMDQAIDDQEAQEINQMNLIDAELGDEDVIRITGSAETEHIELSKTVHSWDIYKGMAKSYRRKGDEESVDKLMSIFPEHSQLQEELQRELDRTRVDPEFEDSVHLGKVSEVVRGTRYDLIPGKVDMRQHVQDNVLDENGLVEALLTKLKELDTVYAEDSVEVNDTLQNVRKKFGEETFLRVAESFNGKWQNFEDSKNK